MKKFSINLRVFQIMFNKKIIELGMTDSLILLDRNRYYWFICVKNGLITVYHTRLVFNIFQSEHEVNNYINNIITNLK